MYQPYPSGGEGPPPARPGPPPPVQLAVKLMYAGAGVSAISLIISLATIGTFRRTLHQADPSLTSAQLHAAEITAISVGVIVGLIGIGLWVWMALANRAGMSWARIVASVLFALDTVLIVISITQPAEVLSRVISFVIWAIGFATIVLLWRKDASQYYAAMSPRR
jgi:uncharacterized membrane protein